MKIYENPNIRVIWDTAKCIHAGRCTDGLPLVFDPGRKPWIDVNAAPVQLVMEVIDRCPSGALSYQLPGPGGKQQERKVIIRVSENGPYVVSGDCDLVSCRGDTIRKSSTFALCRCGHSSTMPFCDASHRRVGYREPQQAMADGSAANEETTPASPE